MWGKRKSSDEAAKQQALKNRLDAVLGLDLAEPGSDANPTGDPGPAENGVGAGPPVSIAVKPSEDDGSASPPETSRAANGHNNNNGNGHISQFPAGTSARSDNGNSPGSPGETVHTHPPRPANSAQESRPAASVVRNGESELADWREQCAKVLESQSNLFRERLARIAEEGFSQARATAQGIVSQLEASLAQAEDSKSSIDAGLTQLSAKSRETADAQTSAFEANFVKFTGRIGAVDEMLTGRVDEYHAQIKEMLSSVELTLTNFSRKTQEAVQVQAQAFGQEMDRIAQQAQSQAEDNIEDKIAKLRETAAHSLEEQIAALLEQVRNSQSQADALLAKVEGVRLQCGSEVEEARRSIAELHQQEIESALQTLKDQAAKEIESLTAKVSQDVRDQARNEAAAATTEFVEQESQTRIQQAFQESYEKFEQDLIARLQSLSSEKQQSTLAQLRTQSQELAAELIQQIQSRSEESLAKATTALDDNLRAQVQANIDSAAEALKGQAAKEIEALTESVSQDIRNQVRSEASAATREFVEQESQSRIQQAFQDSYEKFEQDLIARLRNLSSEKQQSTLDQLRTQSQELVAELIQQIQSRSEESLAKATTALDDNLRMRVQANIESAVEALKGQATREIEALSESVSQDIRNQVRSEASAATHEFVEQESQTRIQQALQESYEKFEQDLITRLQRLSAEKQQVTLDGLRTQSQELAAELTKQIQSRCDDSLKKASVSLDDNLRARVQANIDSATEALKGQATREIEALSESVSQDIRNQVRSEASAATREFVEQEGHARIQQAFQESYEKFEQDLITRLQRLSAEKQQVTLDGLRTQSQELAAELTKQIQSRCDDSLKKASVSLDDNLRMQVQANIESAVEALKGQAAKEIELLTNSVSQEIRDLHGSYEKLEGDLAVRLQELSSERQRLTLDDLRTQSQELSAELIKQIKGRCDETLRTASVTLDGTLRTQVQANIESAVEALKGQTAKEIEALTESVSQEIRDQVQNEAAAATREFVEQEGHARIQQAFQESYEKFEQDLIARLQSLSSEKQQSTLDQLRTQSQELATELIQEIQSRSEESLAKAKTALDDNLRARVQANIDSAAEALKGQAAKEIEALSESVSQEIQKRVRTEAAAATSEFVEQEGQSRIQQAFQDSYEKFEQDLIARLQNLSSEKQQSTLDQLRTQSQELATELVQQIQSRSEESLAKATAALDDKLRTQVQGNITSAVETLKRQASKELESLTRSTLQEIRDRVRNEVAAATSEFIEQEGRTRIQEAFHGSYQKYEQHLSSEGHRALDHLQTKSQELGAKLIKQIQSRGEESLAKAATALDYRLRTQVQANIDSAVEALKAQAAKEIEALTESVSREIRDRVRNEAAAATSEFVEQEGRARIQQAFQDSHEKYKQELSSETQLALDHLQTKSQELGAEFIRQTQARGEENLGKTILTLDQKLRTQVQANIEFAAAALKGEAANEVEALAPKISQDIRERARNEAAAATMEFIQQEGRARIEQAFHDSYDKCEKDLIAKLQKLSSERQQMTLDHLQAKSQELGAEMIKRIQSRGEEGLKKATAVLDLGLRVQGARLKESGESLNRDIEAGLQEKMQAWSKAHLEGVQQQANKIFADFLSRMRAESDSVAQGRPQLKSSGTAPEEGRTIEDLDPNGASGENSPPRTKGKRLRYWAGALTLGAVLGWIGIATDQHLDGSSAVPFAPSTQVWGDIAPTWSPDDREVIYCDRRQEERKLYIASVNKGAPRPFLSGRPDDCMAGWSPDGARVAFSSSQRGEFQLVSALGLARPLNIWTASASGGDLQQLTNSSASLGMHWSVDPSWSPDGTEIAFTAYPGPRVVTVPASGGEAQVFANGFSPAWSPDGTHLAYLSKQPEQGGTRLSVFIQSAQDGETKRLGSFVVKPDFLFRPTLDWSPDGQSLLTVQPVSGQWQPAIIKIADGRVERTFSVPGSVVGPRWSHDGKRIAYGLSENGHPAKIEVLTLANEQRAELTQGTGYAPAELDRPQERPDSEIPAASAARLAPR